MAIRLFVGSLSYGVDDQQLKDFFSTVGQVTSASVINDRDTGRSKGFAFAFRTPNLQLRRLSPYPD